ncbi:contractile injection system tape measure protein [Larkinella sp. GY13]|uniref:contractile injection system tape measure protein n=1 Tax=Larkinella sp. GY13 TaxID=3453720 RepID=UPI003EEA10ED
MALSVSHIIQRQTVRLHLREQTDSWAVQERASQILRQTDLLTALDAVLSAYGSADEWIELERVEVDLGVLSAAGFEEQIARNLPDLLRRQLADLIPKARFHQGTAVRKTGEVVFETFLYFLEMGLLPPTTLWPESNPAFEQQIRSVLSSLNTPQKETLRAVLVHPATRFRLVNQFSEDVLAAVFRALGSGHESVSLRLLKHLQAWRDRLPANHYRALLTALTEKTVQDPEAVLQALENRWVHIKPSDPTFNLALELLLPAFQQSDIKSGNSLPNRQDVGSQVSENYPEIAKSTSNRASSDTLGKTRRESPTEVPADAVFYVRNAGVVLLHPFLRFCFEACGWTQDAVFRDADGQEKALTMLHFLATGEPTAAEYDLLLPKLLCEMPWNSPVSGKISLTGAEQEEGIGLLNAAIGHWAVLKNTSPDGFREGFLQRDGKLTLLPNGLWELTVESKAQDILLDRLPVGWGVGTVLLPWMKKQLTVNWAS